ncbi:cupin domain-containing protein [uncultured Pseudoteredinibacter sp.]|uniref:cupin domain-containing protein n=1 Tax=uncultured Pseudoteredinibacter sp. TaxID=1641701 RepID=UPI002607901B|nr:cupin domain-containing protein [uncultured Pseudoteredinibacter sp.]
MSKSILRMPASSAGGESSPIDPSKLISGQPMQETHNMFTNTAENFFCGVWRSDAGKWNIEYSEDEFCYMISGEAIICSEDGQTETVKAGDAFTIPAGFKGTWESIGHAQKFYAIYEESE